MFTRSFIITILFTILTGLYVHCQEAEIQVSKKLKARIKLSEQSGNNNIPDAYYDDKDSIYFSVELTEGDEFYKGIINDLNALHIEQAGRIIAPGYIKSIRDVSIKIIRLVFSYYKANIDIYQPFEFKYESYPPVAFQVPDKYWPKYHVFDQYYNTGKELCEQLKFIESYQQLENVLPGKENYTSFKRFVQYDQVINELIPTDINGTLMKFEIRLSNFRSLYGNKEQIATEELDHLKLTHDSLNSHNVLFGTFYQEINNSKSIELSQKHVKLIEDYNGFYKECKIKWKSTMLSIFESGEYGRENKFTVYTNLLSRILCYNQRINDISLFDSIDMSLVINQGVELPFVKKYLDLLYEMSWEQEFISIIKVINDEIKNNKRILPGNHLNNFKNLINSEDQPNFYILSAFNELAKERPDGFISNIELAIAKCTDKELLYQLELWIFANDIKRQNISKDVLENINLGMDYEAKSMPNDAFSHYQKATRLNDKFSLSYFLMGRVELVSRKNNFTADQYFNDAIKRNPGFALARIYHLEILIENQQFKEVLNEISAIVNNSGLNIWYIYYLNAKVLHLTNDNAGALSVLTSVCNNYNQNSFEQFLLVGDIYLAMNKCEEARKNYQEAGNLRPDSKYYTDKMENLNNRCTK